MWPEFTKNSHKGERGKVLIVAGSPQLYGSAIFNALGAEHAGADLISLYLPHQHTETAKQYSLNLFLHSFVHPCLGLKDIGLIDSLIPHHHCMLIGSGIGLETDSLRAANILVSKATIPVVVDADVLQPEIICRPHNNTVVITPHKAEFQRLFGEEPTAQNAIFYAAKYNLIIVAKGATDIIACPNEVYLNHTGCPQMRVGGTGDTLAGIISSFIAQGMQAFEAAVSACHYFGKVAEVLATTRHSFTSLELIKKFSMKA